MGWSDEIIPIEYLNVIYNKTTFCLDGQTKKHLVNNYVICLISRLPCFINTFSVIAFEQAGAELAQAKPELGLKVEV